MKSCWSWLFSTVIWRSQKSFHTARAVHDWWLCHTERLRGEQGVKNTQSKHSPCKSWSFAFFPVLCPGFCSIKSNAKSSDWKKTKEKSGWALTLFFRKRMKFSFILWLRGLEYPCHSVRGIFQPSELSIRTEFYLSLSFGDVPFCFNLN